LQPTAGFVQRSLAAAGIDPKVDRYGVADPHAPGSLRRPDRHVERAALFPNAELVMHENELAHWFDDGAMAKVDERSAQLYFQAGREQVAPYKNRTRLFREGEVFPGVTAVPSLGHTPGHTAYLIASGNDQLMIWGDTVHVPEVQTAFPEAGMAFDTDLAAAAAARKRMFDRVSADGILIAGMHLHFPGVLAAGTARVTPTRFIPRPGSTRYSALTPGTARDGRARRFIERPIDLRLEPEPGQPTLHVTALGLGEADLLLGLLGCFAGSDGRIGGHRPFAGRSARAGLGKICAVDDHQAEQCQDQGADDAAFALTSLTSAV
jgi:glyoxylase-like metal-dependent hydrolase (beta-lactamase superfamily II)